MKRQIPVWWMLTILCANLRVFGATPQIIGQWPSIPNGPIESMTIQGGQPLTVQGNLLYAKTTKGGAVFDASDPAHLRRISTLGRNGT